MNSEPNMKKLLKSCQKQKYCKKILQKKVTEKINDYGIMEGSILTVNVVEARELIPQDINGSSDPYTIIGIEGQRQSTKYIRTTTNPLWNETLTLY